MSLKNEFVIFCECQRNADELLRSSSPQEDHVIKAFEKANEMKRSLIVKLEAIDYENRYIE